MAQDTYAGDLSAQEAWDLLSREEGAVLVDCRSRAEWSFVGVPVLDALGREPLLVEWQSFPGMRPNPDFAEQLAAAGASADRPAVFLCRSGARSKAAAIAMTARGWRRCYNLAGGFEGPQDAERHRGRVDGWKAAGLPWRQD